MRFFFEKSREDNKNRKKGNAKKSGDRKKTVPASGKRSEVRSKENQWAEFDGETEGIIIRKENPMVGVSVITVEYSVDGEEYLLQNVVQLKNPPKRISVYPPLEKGIPILGSVEPGSTVRVKYKTGSPDQAYLPDNQQRD